jgi:hypothetical protein
MFVYYLIDLRQSKPKIIYLYFSDNYKYNKEELIKKYIGGNLNEASEIVYSRVPLTEICGIDHLCSDEDEKNIYFFYLGGYEFYYSIGKTLEDAISCLDMDINHERWQLVEKIVKNGQYDFFSLDQINNQICLKCK